MLDLDSEIILLQKIFLFSVALIIFVFAVTSAIGPSKKTLRVCTTYNDVVRERVQEGWKVEKKLFSDGFNICLTKRVPVE